MKSVSLVLVFLILVKLNTSASNLKGGTKNFPEKEFKVAIKTSLNLHAISAVAYFWGFDGDCIQL